MKRLNEFLILVCFVTLATFVVSCSKDNEESISEVEFKSKVKFESMVVDPGKEVVKSSTIWDGYWARWMSPNPNYNEENRELLQGLSPVTTGIMVREQSGYGIINIALLGKRQDGAELETDWLTTNFRGHEISKSFSDPSDYATEIVVKEQSGYGIIDVKLNSQKGNTTGWLTGNTRENYTWTYKCSYGYKIVGIGEHEQSGYGIVNVRVYVMQINN